MPICKPCNRKFEMLTESHMKSAHKINCKDYRIQFNVARGEMNPEHSKKMTGDGNPVFGKPRPLTGWRVLRIKEDILPYTDSKKDFLKVLRNVMSFKMKVGNNA